MSRNYSSSVKAAAAGGETLDRPRGRTAHSSFDAVRALVLDDADAVAEALRAHDVRHHVGDAAVVDSPQVFAVLPAIDLAGAQVQEVTVERSQPLLVGRPLFIEANAALFAVGHADRR